VIKILIIIAVILFSFSDGYAEDLYYSEEGTVGDTGANCANAFDIDAISWGVGAGEIDPGDTIHICGTITGQFTIAESGTSGNVITIKFEDDAKFSAPKWTGGAIIGTTHEFILIDGGTNGKIEATDNGSAAGGYTYQDASAGISFDGPGVNDVEIKNLTIQNMYVRTSTSDWDEQGLESSVGIYIGGGTDNIWIHDNVFTHCSKVTYFYYREGSEDFRFYNNTANYFHTGLVVGQTGAAYSLTGLYIYGNTMNYGTTWNQDNDTDYYHADIVHTWAYGGATIETMRIYNNYFGPDHPERATNSPTSTYVYFQGVHNDVMVYNNVFEITDGLKGPNDGILVFQVYTTNIKIYNNTFDGPDTGYNTAVHTSASPSVEAKNNIIININRGFYLAGDLGDSAHFDYNVYGADVSADRDSGPNSSIGTDPTLDANFVPTVADAVARNQGLNLSAYFTTDKDGNTRVVPWDIGAYEYESAVPANAIQGVTIN